MADVIEAADLTARHIGSRINVKTPEQQGAVMGVLQGFTAEADRIESIDPTTIRLSYSIELDFGFARITVPGGWDILIPDTRSNHG